MRLGVWLGWYLAILALAGTVFDHPGLHFDSLVSLRGDPEASGARYNENFEKIRKSITWELNREPFRAHFETVAS